MDQRDASLRRFEISPYGVDYFGDKLNHSFIVGSGAQLNLTETLGLAVDFGYSRASVDGTSAFGATFTDKNEYLIDGSFVITVPAIYRSKKGYTEADFYTSIGGGIMRLNGGNHGAGFIGGGMLIRPKVSWLAIRIDIRNYFTSVANPVGSDFEDELTLRIGPTFLIPPEF